ncbi:MAG: contractile injection system tape measure protein [Bacteroidota bacterium]
MENQYFSVREQLFDIRFSNRSQVHALQNRISSLANNSLLPALDQSLHKIIPADKLIRVDTMVLDIGEIRFDSLDEELVPRIVDELEKQLQLKFEEIRNKKPPSEGTLTEIIPPVKGNEELLTYFLVYGTMPWWIHASAGFDINTIVSELFGQNDALLRLILLDTGRYEYVRKRMVSQFNEESIRQMISVLEPDEASFIFGYHESVVRTQQEQQVVKTEQVLFEKAVWLFILNFILDERGGEFNRRIFAKSILMQMAAHFNIGYTELLHLFYQSLYSSGLPDSRHHLLAKTITELTIEETVSDAGLPEELPGISTPPVDLLAEKMRLLVYYLSFGYLPATATIHSPKILAPFFAELVQRIPQTLQRELANMPDNSAVAARYFSLLGNTQAKEMLHQLYPGKANVLTGFLSAFEWLSKKQFIAIPSTADAQTALLRLVFSRIVFGDPAKNDPKELVAAYIRSIAEQYRMQERILIQQLHEGMQFEFRQGIRQSGIPGIIAELADTPVVDVPVNEKKTEQEVLAVEKDALLEALLYTIRYAQIPWWGRYLFDGVTVESLVQKLMDENPENARKLFRDAGSSARNQNRLLAYISLPVWVGLLKLFSVGENAATVFQNTIRMIERAFPEYASTEQNIGKKAALFLWIELESSNYRSFSQSVFLSLLITGVSIDLKEPSLGIAEALQKIIDQEMKDSGSGAILSLKNNLNEFILVLQKQELATDKNKELQKILAAFQSTADATEISGLPAVLTTLRQPTRERLLSDAVSIIEYYLRWNRLPDEINTTVFSDTRFFLHQLIMLVYLLDADLLIALLKNDRYEYSSRKEMSSLFDAKRGGIEKRIAVLFDQLQLQETIPSDRVINSTDETARKAGLQTILFHLNLEAATNNDADLFNGLPALLDYFVTWNRFPDQWKETRDFSFSDLLKQLITWLFANNRQELTGILQKQTHIPEARLLLHELFSESGGIAEKELVLFMAPYQEWYLIKQMQNNRSQAEIVQQPFITQGTDATAPVADKAVWIEWLDRFLSSGRPVHTKNSNDAEDSRLVENMLKLHQVDPQAVKQLLDKSETKLQTKIYLYDVLMAQTGYQEKQLVSSLQAYWEKDLVQFLGIATKAESSFAAERVTKTVMQLLNAGNKNTLLWQWAVSSPLFIRFLLTGSEREVLRDFIRKKNIGWGAGMADLLLETRQFMFKPITDYFERDRLIAVVDDYHVAILSGNLSVQSPDVYIRSLFGYMRQVAYSIPLNTLQVLLQHIKNNTAGQVIGSLTPILKTELQAHIQYADRQYAARNRQIENEQQRKDNDSDKETKEREEALQDLIRQEMERLRLQAEAQMKKESEKPRQGKPNKIYIRNAGLVLLHPFLGAYFTRNGLLENGRFVNEEAQQRAVVLLQYLVNGRTQTDEFELPLNKILCGLMPEDPIPLEITITEEEESVSNELFKVIFERWEKMKNSSVAGFRASFLQREGALSENEENWELRIEQRSYDMLLDTLPWAFGMIKNTWMNQILTVEWT